MVAPSQMPVPTRSKIMGSLRPVLDYGGLGGCRTPDILIKNQKLYR